MLKKVAFIFVALLGFQSTASGALYQWVDEKGGVHYSNQPPTTGRTAPIPTPASNPRTRAFPVPKHGNLILNVPETWDHEVRQAREDQPPTIVLTPREGDDFEVLITPIFDPENTTGYNSSEMTKRFITADLGRMLPTAVERDVQIVEIPGKYDAGYYFLVTDKASGTGYPYMVCAGIGVGDLLLYVTVLNRSKESEGIRQTLRAIQGAVQIKG